MIERVSFNENDGSIDLVIDNSELLNERSDMSDEEEEKLQDPNLGGRTDEKKIETDKKRLNWREPNKKQQTHILHVCPICGTQYYGRTNKLYCDTPCKEIAKKRRQRERKRNEKVKQ
jgi:predicted nucleic acid-binding Zn ribbon protein